MKPELLQDELSDLPDDFYELSIEEVRKIYTDLQQKRMEFEEIPLVTSAKREQLEKEVKHCLVTVETIQVIKMVEIYSLINL